MQGDWLVGGPTLPDCPEVPAMGEVNFTTTKDTILVTSPKVSSVVCTVPVIIGILHASPNQIDFGSQKVKTTASRAIMVSNVGFGPVTINGVTSSKPNVFGESDNCKGILQTSSTCTLTATFTRGSKGKVEGSLTINNNGGPLAIGLAGKGT
jgi:Abnormal spindle-like microcephaly-assoc'd, ASPM-SPD-2-Hydin